MSYYGVNHETQVETIWFESPQDVAEHLIECDEDLQDWTCQNHYGTEILFSCELGRAASYFKPFDDFCINEVNWPGERCQEHREEDE